MNEIDFTLNINNSMTKLSIDKPVGWINSLYTELSYQDKDAMYAYKKATKRYKEIRKYLIKLDDDGRNHIFPTGLLETVRFWAETMGLKCEVIDNRVEPSNTRYFKKVKSLPPLRDYQTEMLKTSDDEPRGIIEAATGVGKTRMMLELVGRKALPTLIVVPSLNILKQTHKQYADLYSPAVVGIVGGGKEQLTKPITIATFQSLLEKPQSFFNQFEMLFVDEAHHSAADTITQINERYFDHIYYRYFFTATPFRNDGADLALEGVISDKKIFTYDFKKACKDGWLVPPHFLIYPWEHKMSTKNDYRLEYKHLIAENLDYNQHVADVVRSLIKKDRHVIVFVKQIVQGELLKGMIPGSVLLTGKEKIDDSEQIIQDFEDKKFNVLIGTSVIGEGVDLKTVDCGVMAGAGRSRGDIIQKIGRLLRPQENKKNCLIVDFTHSGGNYSERHAKERFKIYKEYGTGIYYLD